MDIRLSEVISALSYALDVTEGQPMGHAVRSCAIGMRIGEEIGLGDHTRSSHFCRLGLRAGRLNRDARVLAVADVCEALSAKRPYRDAMDPEQVRATMRRDAGTAVWHEALGALEEMRELGPVTLATPVIPAAPRPAR